MELNKNTIPVTIITGFLGSGKTTLLNNIISKYQDRKFAVIENEFGDIGIDGGLIVEDAKNIFELSNGCICCSLQGDFLETINTLLDSSLKFDHLLIETTGIADPDSVVSMFISSEELQKRFIIDSVICVADAVNIEDFIDEQREVRKQIALSDYVLINKADSVHQTYIKDLFELIRKINPVAKCDAVSYSNIDSISILDNFSFAGQSIEKTTTDFPLVSGITLDTQRLLNTHDISSEAFILKGDIALEKFETWMSGFLFFNSHNIFRIKGILSISNSNIQSIFQAVKNSYKLEEGKIWSKEERYSKFVFIGKHLDRQMIENSLAELVITNE